MSEPAQLAKSARELLAAALNALQSNGGVSPQVEALAEPIAQAMGIMHRIERSGGQTLDGSDVALGHVRDVLNRLQSVTVSDPVVDVLMEHVASSLSKVHALSRAQAAGAQAPVAAPAPVAAAVAAPVAVAAPAPVAVAAPIAAPVAVAAAPIAAPVAVAAPIAAPVAVAAPIAAPAPVAVAAPPPIAAPAPVAVAAPPPVAVAAPPPVAVAPPPAPVAAPPHLQQTLPSPQQPRHAPAPPAHPAADARSAPPFQATLQSVDNRAPAAVVDVELGALTPSNFYKGLAGNDVVEHGGIFVATYKIPPIGTAVTLRVRLPGNYEFTALATVRWTREAGGSRDSAEPGFGARITQISAEGRQLVSRFTRNREPLFYDDL
ncbi:hypothetical protein WME76_37305 [Sorangium sp. So ce119]|uniref:hypothetical protein n=1 Tax=Sorangium sp. So ce119 TaxID=3133279 RepID=UPI003F5DC04B